MSLRLLALAAWVGAIGFSPPQAADTAPFYRTPPQRVTDTLTAPRLPHGAPNLAPDGARLVLPKLPALILIAVLAKPV